ncbi:hypothetical protein BSL78_07542 [Apostichopus japonicus]|uniref:CCHC-type domain-containing protein n=1 Tax=Stichopus japonicus TaxID=307972 RepID=A0A2G8L5K1_STIJA|nr:hypothetical protein BSL78_07542 [Apostichopus japonicus]
MSALRELSLTCNFGTFLDEMLRDQLVEKTNSTRIRERLLLETDLKLPKAIETARQVEQAVRDSRSISGKMPEEATCANVKFTRGKNSDRSNHRSGDARNSQSQFTKSRGNSSFTNQNTPDNRGRQCCYRCGSKQHLAKSHLCRAKNAKCDACGKTGHFARVCLQNNNNASVRKVDSTQSSTLHNPSTTDEGADSVQVLGISNVTGPAVEAGSAKPSIVCDLEINSISLRFVVDTGSDITLMNARRFDKYFLRESLGPINKKLVSYNNTVIQTLGCFTAKVGYKGKSMHANIYVVEVGISLIGKDVIQGLGLQLDGKSLSCLQPGFKPVQQQLRRIPFAVRGKVANELKRLTDEGVIEPVREASEWVSPVVVAWKKDGGIRICVDLRKVNEAVVIEKYPLPNIDELLSELRNAKFFSKLDLKSAYYQLELEEVHVT